MSNLFILNLGYRISSVLNDSLTASPFPFAYGSSYKIPICKISAFALGWLIATIIITTKITMWRVGGKESTQYSLYRWKLLSLEIIVIIIVISEWLSREHKESRKKTNQIALWWERKSWVPREKPLGAERLRNNLNPNMTSSLESHPGHFGGRLALSPLRQACSLNALK